MITKERKPVSRIDHKRTHGYLARVYRGDWVGSRSFADGKCGGRRVAEKAAAQWVKIADTRLPKIPPMPVLREAAFYRRADTRRTNSFYFDVYLPAIHGNGSDTKRIYFRTPEEEEKQRRIASSMVANQNFLLEEAHKKAMVRWQREYVRLMEEILKLWDEIKAMPT